MNFLELVYAFQSKRVQICNLHKLYLISNVCHEINQLLVFRSLWGAFNTKMHIFLLLYIFHTSLCKKHLQCTAIHAGFGRQIWFSLAKIWLRSDLIPAYKYCKGSYRVEGTKFFSVVTGDLAGDNGHCGRILRCIRK